MTLCQISIQIMKGKKQNLKLSFQGKSRGYEHQAYLQ